MSYYRLYFLDQTSHINGVREFEAVSDETAVSIARREANGLPFELWNYDRLVWREQKVADAS